VHRWSYSPKNCENCSNLLCLGSFPWFGDIL